MQVGFRIGRGRRAGRREGPAGTKVQGQPHPQGPAQGPPRLPGLEWGAFIPRRAWGAKVRLRLSHDLEKEGDRKFSAGPSGCSTEA